MMKKMSAFLALAVSSVTAFAETTDKKLATDVEFGFITTSGNTETTSLKGSVNVKQDLEKFRNNYVLEAFYKEDEVSVEAGGISSRETQTTAEKYFFSVQSDLKLDAEHKGIFFFGSYEQDEFSSFEYQATIALGYSDRLFTRDNSYFSYSIGPGMAYNEIRETGETNEIGIVRASAEYRWQISENARFKQTLSSEIPFESDENRKTKAETSLNANIVNDLAMKIAFVVDHNSQVSEGIEKADTQTSVTLVYSF